MKRSAPLRRTAFKRSASVLAASAQKQPRELKPATRTATYSGSVQPAPKSAPKRNARLLRLAYLMPCLFRLPGICLHPRVDTTVACHSNFAEDGKGGARKADDHKSAWGCAACHHWFDFGPAPAEEKRRQFKFALVRQYTFWRQIAADTSWPEADRKAAQWAVDQLEKEKQ